MCKKIHTGGQGTALGGLGVRGSRVHSFSFQTFLIRKPGDWKLYFFIFLTGKMLKSPFLLSPHIYLFLWNFITASSVRSSDVAKDSIIEFLCMTSYTCFSNLTPVVDGPVQIFQLQMSKTLEKQLQGLSYLRLPGHLLPFWVATAIWSPVCVSIVHASHPWNIILSISPIFSYLGALQHTTAWLW